MSVNYDESATYDQLRKVIARYERATQKWATQLVFGSSTASRDPTTPMEVDVVWSGKGGKLPKGKDKGDQGVTTTTWQGEQRQGKELLQRLPEGQIW